MPNFGSSVFSFAGKVTIYYLSGTTGWDRTVERHVPEEAPNGGIPVDDLPGWFQSDWFGYYYTFNTDPPWLLHDEHGFIFPYPGSTNASMYFYDDAMGAWWWTNQTFYPYIYAFNPPADHGPGTDIGDEWLFYIEGSNDPRLFGVLTGEYAGELLYFNP